MGKIKAIFALIVYIYNYFHPTKQKDPEVERLQDALQEKNDEELERQKPIPTNMAAATSELPKS